MSLSAWARPVDPTVYGWLDVDVSHTLRYLDELDSTDAPKVTLTHVVGKAVALAIAECPSVNAIIRRGRIHLRETVDVFFQVAYEDGEDLSGATIASADRKSLQQIARELSAQVAAIREHRPHGLARSEAWLRNTPTPLRTAALRMAERANYDWNLDLTWLGVPRDAFGCAMITNVGTFGLRHALAPLVPFSRAPIVVTMGAVHDAPVVERGELVVRPVLPLGVTLDHRVLDGYQAGRLARHLEAAFRDPGSAFG